MNKRKRLVLERFAEAYAYKVAPRNWRINIMLDGVPHTLASGITEAQAWLLAHSCPTLPKQLPQLSTSYQVAGKVIEQIEKDESR